MSLSRRWVWLFSSGPTGLGDPAALAHGWLLPKDLQSTADRIAPRDVALFGGKIQAEQFADDQLGVLQRTVLKVVHPPLGDYRDWATIRAWASSISRSMERVTS
jgi:menaquinone-dependent protoporphyrinogen oxidase